jgi:hypothetical protein
VSTLSTCARARARALLRRCSASERAVSAGRTWSPGRD